ncbi:hypothetical protein OHA98_39750 [Streptomyces sp. NBC_00654]|uniref:hypothetical protein n=1 Tax=Streptomyces sp. NBC_00654 TaxID=2975799 RepID=UPI002258F2F4|nr:hypothetical protein [Streptomyces sp. NBC_00654]MCX4970779.1 hypothetical protein [Streptomyces sp. NBC_00654]
MGVARTVGGKRLDPALKRRFLERLDVVGSVSPVARELGLVVVGVTIGHEGTATLEW